MNSDLLNSNSILAKIGLREIMIWKDPDPPFYRNNNFDTYVSNAYKNFELKEMDELYRMSEIVLIHKISGMRIEYVNQKIILATNLLLNLKIYSSLHWKRKDNQ